MAQADKFWDRMADKYAAQPVADEVSYRRKLEVTQSYFTPESEVLEFGCGTGSTAIVHAPHVRHITAIDVSKRMIEIARVKADAEGVTNVSFQQADITDTSLPTAHYDVVLGLSILHLLKDPDAVIARVYEVLKPGGLFVSSTACLGANMKFIKYLAPLGQAVGLLPTLNVMTPDELTGKVTMAGFEIVHRWEPGKGKAVFLIGRKPA